MFFDNGLGFLSASHAILSLALNLAKAACGAFYLWSRAIIYVYDLQEDRVKSCIVTISAEEMPGHIRHGAVSFPPIRIFPTATGERYEDHHVALFLR